MTFLWSLSDEEKGEHVASSPLLSLCEIIYDILAKSLTTDQYFTCDVYDLFILFLKLWWFETIINWHKKARFKIQV